MVTVARIALAGAFGLTVAAGCGFDSTGSDNPLAPGLGVQESTGEAPDPSTPSGDTEGGGAGLSTSGTTSTTGPGNTSDPTGDPSAPGDTADSGGTGDASGGNDETTGPAGNDDGGPPLTEADVENTDLSACSQSVGCWSDPPNVRPAGPWTAVECFESPVAPPYEVTTVRFGVSWVSEVFDTLDLVVFEQTSSGLPDNAVWTGYTTQAPNEGMNDLTFGGLAPTISTPGFCVALRVPDGGWDGGVEWATNPSQPVSAASYYGNCGVTQWTGLGQSWCIGARVEQTN